MASDLASLRQQVKHYSAPDLVATHVQPVLRACDSLHASVNEFIFNDGRSQLLLSLSGVIPISITTRGQHNTYNCPLAIWLPLNYPSEPPVVLILPRGNMVLKGTKTRNEQSRLEVDRDGKVICPYLTEWGRKGEGCSLIPLLDILKHEFSLNYPLVSVASGSQASTSSVSRPAPSSSASPPPRPMPPPHASPSMSNQSMPPRPAPPPSANGPSQRPMEHYDSRYGSPLRGSPAPQSPTYTPQPQQRSEQYAAQSTGPYAPYPPSSSPAPGPPQQYGRPYSTPPRPLPPQIPPQQQQTYQPPPPPHLYTNGAGPPQPSYHPPPLQPPAQAPRVMLNPKAPAPNLLDNDDLPSPLSSNPYGLSNAAPPPLPPNPALLALRAQVHLRLSTSLHQLHGSTTHSLAQLALLGDDLGKGPSAIEDEMKRLEIVRDVCQVVRARYEEVVRTGQERREVYRRKLGSDGLGPEVDEIVCSVSVVHNQLLDLVAEDLALEDTIYHLGRALQSESIELDLDKFLKRVRILAMKQFEKRTLINQILAGLPS